MPNTVRAVVEIQKVKVGSWTFFECPACEERMDRKYHRCPFCRQGIEWVGPGTQ